ncbi:DUF1353 domain-containing protein [Pseudonocardia sp. T1-2H]|uniref:DUF1353 domain-containing protein n=1 Tax=Pseudonocardia sp. T1-2H TaxID=3128899 RepID=UPI003100BE07
MSFLSTDVSVDRANDRYWRLNKPIIYKGAEDTFVVPASFLTDFASVPRFVTWLVPITGKYTEAAILHDWLCTVGIDTGVVSPVDADGILRRVAAEEGVSWLLRWLIWLGVRWGAAGNPARRPGWWSTAPTVLPATLLVLPLLLPAVLLVLATLGLFGIVGDLARMLGLR